ncbi:kinesin-like nuclear fusion protein [Parahypoxylon ruwenzoriense]
MNAMSMENRIDNIESRIKALDRTIGNLVESQKTEDNYTRRSLNKIQEVQVQIQTEMEDLCRYFEQDVLGPDGKVDNHFSNAIRTAQENIIKEMRSHFESLQSSGGHQDRFALPAQATSSSLESDEFENQSSQTEAEDMETRYLLVEAQAGLDAMHDEFEEAREAHKIIEMRLREEIKAEQQRSRVLFDKLQEMKGNIRVMARIRPASADTPTDDLADFGPREKGFFTDKWGKISIPVERTTAKGTLSVQTRSFEFERIFGPEESNDDVFNEISDLVELALRGESVGIFAYGQTGSGKTYTLNHRSTTGTLSDEGMIPRTLTLLFEAAQRESNRCNYSISVSVLEIYVDSTYDLLAVEGEKTETRLDRATFLPLENIDEAHDIIDRATGMRAVSSTVGNAASSRSHLILALRITRKVHSGEDEGRVDHGLLNIVDLAGTERPAATGMEGQQLREGKKINKSLMSLTQAITALGEGRRPSFDNALIKALRPCLSPESKSLMFVMVSPLKKDLSVTIQTLEKGQDATNAKLAATNRGSGRPSMPRSPASSSFPGRPSPSVSGRNTAGGRGRTPPGESSRPTRGFSRR